MTSATPFILQSRSGQQCWIDRCLLPILDNHGVRTTSSLWLMDEGTAEIGRTGIVKNYLGHAPGSASGVTYYNQVTVSGTLSPDATGTYTAGGMYNGKPYYYGGNDTRHIWWTGSQYRITDDLGANGITGYWAKAGDVIGPYGPVGIATGTATVAAVPASGIYLFQPSGLTPGVAGPIIDGELTRAMGLATSGNVVLGSPLIDPSGAFSFEAWINCTVPSGATEQFIFSSAASSTKRFSLSIKSDVLQSGYNNGTTTYATSGTITTGWHYVAFSKASGNAAPALYIDGIAQGGTTAPTFASTVKTILGSRNDSTLFFAGSIGPANLVPAERTQGEFAHTHSTSKGLFV